MSCSCCKIRWWQKVSSSSRAFNAENQRRGALAKIGSHWLIILWWQDYTQCQMEEAKKSRLFFVAINHKRNTDCVVYRRSVNWMCMNNRVSTIKNTSWIRISNISCSIANSYHIVLLLVSPVYLLLYRKFMRLIADLLEFDIKRSQR